VSDRLTIYKHFTFEASHVLPNHPGKCANLHGHSWKLTVGVSGPVNPETGFVVDYAILSELVKAHIINVVDHQHLGHGDIELGAYQKFPAVLGASFYPSSENLVKAFVRILQPLVQELGESERLVPEPGTEVLGEPSGPNMIVIPASIQLEEVSLDETCTCRATWRRSDGCNQLG